jgi:hypothetical protein
MKNTILKTIGMMTLVMLMLTAFTQISVSAQDIGNNVKDDEKSQEEDAAMRRENTRKLEGVWNISVTARNCQTGDPLRTFLAMHTYMRGGTMSDFGTGTPPNLRTPGMGIWSYQSRGHYTTAFQFFRNNADGTLAGKQISRAQLQLSQDGNSYTSVSTAQVLDINGNVIQNNCSTATATRFQ